jgi:pyruvate carboxylase subunit B
MAEKFKLTLEGVPYDIERKGDLLLVNGQEFPWKIDGKNIQVGGNPHAVDVIGKTATVDGIAYNIEVVGLEEPKPTKRKAASAAAAEEAGAISAIMPGLIVKILKKEGDKVEAGDVVIILEAMKMQNELHAKQSGTLKHLMVKPGETVEIRQVLAIIE